MQSFTPALFDFLADLREHNDRAWFQANRSRYEEAVQEPALEFVIEFAPRLREISPHFVADARTSGGSLFRIHRDTRFSKDKSPYKTNTGIHFRHELARDAHAPGFYLHLEPGQCFAGAGIWHPDSPTLAKIRDAIAADPDGWTAARGDMELGGESLKRPPAGYDREHPLIDDLKRKDFVATAPMSEEAVTSDGFIDEYGAFCRRAAPFVRFLCGAVGARF